MLTTADRVPFHWGIHRVRRIVELRRPRRLTASPTSVLVNDLVAEKISCAVSASVPRKYHSPANSAVTGDEQAVRLPDPGGLGDRIELGGVEADRRLARPSATRPSASAIRAPQRWSTTAAWPSNRRSPSTPRSRSRRPPPARRRGSVGVAAGEEVEGVGDDGEDDLERLDRTAREPGVLQISRPAPRVPQPPGTASRTRGRLRRSPGGSPRPARAPPARSPRASLRA